jgi:hypothetical protein
MDLLNPLSTVNFPTQRVSVGTGSTAVNSGSLPPGAQGIMVLATVSVFIEIHPTNTATVSSIPIAAGVPMAIRLPTNDSQSFRVSCANLLGVLGSGTPVAGDVLIRPISAT